MLTVKKILGPSEQVKRMRKVMMAEKVCVPWQGPVSMGPFWLVSIAGGKKERGSRGIRQSE